MELLWTKELDNVGGVGASWIIIGIFGRYMELLQSKTHIRDIFMINLDPYLAASANDFPLDSLLGCPARVSISRFLQSLPEPAHAPREV